MNLRWGVLPILGKEWSDVHEMTSNAAAAAVKQGYVERGDCTIITSGIKTGDGNTNAIRVYTI